MDHERLRRERWLVRVVLFIVVVNGPLAALLFADFRDSLMSERRARKALAAGVCKRKVPGLPGGRCGQPVTSRIDVFQGYEYRFHEWLCEEHAAMARPASEGSPIALSTGSQRFPDRLAPVQPRLLPIPLPGARRASY